MNSIFKVILFSFLPPFAVNAIQPQNDSTESKNAIYIEMFGNAGFYSINYDRFLYKINSSLKITGRIGYSFYDKELWLSNNLHNMAVEINLLCGKEKAFLETGLGYARTLNLDREYTSPPGLTRLPGSGPDLNDIIAINNSFSLRLGLRYQQTPDGLLFRLAFTPMYAQTGYSDSDKYQFLPWGGISIGHTF